MSYPPPPPPEYPYGGGQPGWPPYGPVQDEGRATTALVLGILSIAICSILAPFAWVVGRNSMKAIDASGGRLGGRGRAQAGYILGIVGTALLVLSAIVLVLVFSFSVSSGSGGGGARFGQ